MSINLSDLNQLRDTVKRINGVPRGDSLTRGGLEIEQLKEDIRVIVEGEMEAYGIPRHEEDSIYDTIKITYDNGFITLEIEAPYGWYVEYGTGIHSELPSTTNGRVWTYWNERENEFWHTKGMEPRPFFRSACQKIQEHINRLKDVR